MDRPVGGPPSDEHWAPDHLVLDRRVFQCAGRLLVERDADGQVLQHSPLADMAAVEQRYPPWALGPFGRVEPERDLPELPGVYALVEHGVVRYVGSSLNLARTFDGRNGLGHISRRDCQTPRHEERCRLNRLVVAAAKAGKVIDVYVMTTQTTKHRPWMPAAKGAHAPSVVAEQLVQTARGAWHLPS